VSTRSHSPTAFTNRASSPSRVLAFPTDLGWVATVWQGERLTELTFGHRYSHAAIKALKLPDAAPDAMTIDAQAQTAFAQRVQAYATGHPDDFSDVPIALDGCTDFQRRVLRQCRRIAHGRTMTYAELAARAGAARAARAVGGVMARNRIPLVIPCHRVVGSGGALGGFSAPDGIRMKRRLLELEKCHAGR
jgi:methylated-DNA-[protein]-cysteine S-methyltransferase